MSRTLVIIEALLLVLPVVSVVVASEPPAKRAYIVGLHELPRGLGDTLHDARVTHVDPALRFVVLETAAPAALESRLAQDERVRYFHEDAYHFHAHLTPNDALFPNQYAPHRIGGPAAWDVTLGSTSVKVCVTDTGLRATHQDIAGRVVAGWNFDAGTSNYADGNGHGTHVATTAVGITGNGVGIAGIAQSSVLVAKVLNDAGSGRYSAVASGLRWCADQGARVTTSSLGGSSGDTALADAVAYAWNEGSVLVASAGNGGPCTSCVGYPAKYANEIAVACTTSTDAQCSYSSSGPEVDIAAPGDVVLAGWSTSDTATKSISGTSMSAPHVAGAAALVAAEHPTWTNAQIRSALESTAKDLGSAGKDTKFGAGLLRADAALGVAPPPAPEPTCGGGPANDCFSRAASLTSSTTASTAGATTEAGEPLSCGKMGATVWYTWTAGAGGTATASTVSAQTTFDTVLAVYSGDSLGALTRLACNDDVPGGKRASQAKFTCTPGATYRIQLGGYRGATGTAALSVSGCESASGAPSAPTSLSETFDAAGSPAGWTLDGLWHVSSACVTANSAPKSLQYNAEISCTYATGARTTGAATTPAIDVSSAAAPTLTFATRYNKELYASGAYDVMRVEAQPVGASTWTTLWTRDSRDADQGAFATVTLDLASDKSAGTRIRFAFDSIDGTSNSYIGWIVDDVRIA